MSTWSLFFATRWVSVPVSNQSRMALRRVIPETISKRVVVLMLA